MDLHQRLKEKTQVYHHQIERTPLLNKLVNSSIDLAGYRILLKQFHAYIIPCEATILCSPWSSLLENRNKTSQLNKDLMDIGTPENIKCPVLPPLITREQIIGYLYVIEGATLGGQIIARILQDKLGLTPQYGARYFNSYGPNTKKMWDEFCHLLNQVKASHEHQVIVSASMTYTAMIDWFNRGVDLK